MSIHFKDHDYTTSKHHFAGTHRAMSPSETLERIKPYFEVAGVTRLSDITGLDKIGIPVVLAIRPNAGYLAVDAGKGYTTTVAIVSAAMETLERWVAEQAEPSTFYAPYDELGRYDLGTIPLEKMPWVRNAVYNTKIDDRWTPCWDLVAQESVAVPRILVDLTRFDWDGKELAAFQSSTNGLASGNVFLEALTAGLYEVIERDATAIQRISWQHTGVAPPAVKLDSVSDPILKGLLDKLDNANMYPVLLDCTVDTDVPTYIAYLIDKTERHAGIFGGYGTHLDPTIAMTRAITEVVQSRLITIAGARDDIMREKHYLSQIFDNQHVASLLENMTPTVDASERADQSAGTFEKDIQTLLNKLDAVGLNQVLVADLTPPDWVISVVRVVVPGLEGYSSFSFYAPGQRVRRALNNKPAGTL